MYSEMNWHSERLLIKFMVSCVVVSKHWRGMTRVGWVFLSVISAAKDAVSLRLILRHCGVSEATLWMYRFD